MTFANTNVSIAINQVGSNSGRVCHGKPHPHKEGPEKPDRNPFLDFLTAPLQATGKMDRNQNDKEYDKYRHANEAGHALKGF